ncbi:hypothetical protein [Rhodococcus rhodochrous]|uniref:hypothetical protein n=1 Tax=Rhodococcus rhodochrous TaxID=1829 RepID=UPI00177E112B|nr:hypothetical protein [Rhodococcus rhodochrous]QOH59850.1 hypothetical protein C6Y44_27545 [Rhodococcus rhodochrous]
MADTSTPNNPFKPGDHVLDPNLQEFGIRSVLTVVRAHKNGNIVARKPGIEMVGHHSTFTPAEESPDAS